MIRQHRQYCNSSSATRARRETVCHCQGLSPLRASPNPKGSRRSPDLADRCPQAEPQSAHGGPAPRQTGSASGSALTGSSSHAPAWQREHAHDVPTALGAGFYTLSDCSFPGVAMGVAWTVCSSPRSRLLVPPPPPTVAPPPYRTRRSARTQHTRGASRRRPRATSVRGSGKLGVRFHQTPMPSPPNSASLRDA